jgi:aspartate kinase
MISRRAVVLKFGGESLALPEEVITLVRQTRRGGTPTVVVASARQGVTDLLRLVVAGAGPDARTLREELIRLNPDLPAAARAILDRTIVLSRETRGRERRDPAADDELLSQGERLSAHWLARRLREADVPAVPVEADRLGLLTDNSYGASRILLEASAPKVREGLRRILRRQQVPVVTGFFGRSLEGRPATLGRGGSDYTASALGGILEASRVELIKRHVAIFTADPRLVSAARPVEHLSYGEAEEFAQFGARVLHPVTIDPARVARVEIRVRSLQDDDLVTTIGPARPGAGTRTVTLLGPLRSISLRIAGGRQRRGIIGILTSRLTDAGINLAAVVTTEAVVGLLVEPSDAETAARVLEPLAREMGATLGRPVPVALVSAVGEGILADLPKVRSAHLAEAQGVLATARSISLVVPEESAVAALRAFHRAFVEQRPPGRAFRTSSGAVEGEPAARAAAPRS